MSTHELLAEQRAYYRGRAPEYDDWWFRRGRYDRGADHRRRWRSEAAEVRAALERACPRGRVLELACGTGIWTRELAPLTDQLLAVDASEEVLSINREKVADPRVRYECADLFEWEPEARFDFIFFGFWLSHVPPSKLHGFWQRLRRWLEPGGSVFFVDSAPHDEYRKIDHEPGDAEPWQATRTLADGRRFEIVKIFYDPDELAARLRSLGWEASVRRTERFFLIGEAR